MQNTIVVQVQGFAGQMSSTICGRLEVVGYNIGDSVSSIFERARQQAESQGFHVWEKSPAPPAMIVPWHQCDADRMGGSEIYGNFIFNTAEAKKLPDWPAWSAAVYAQENHDLNGAPLVNK